MCITEKGLTNFQGIFSFTFVQYGLPFYMQYLAHWPEYFQVLESPSGEIMGYSKFMNFISTVFLQFSAIVCYASIVAWVTNRTVCLR